MINLLYLTIFLLIVAIPWINGVLDIIIALKFRKESGADQTAFGINWIAWKWSWINQRKAIVKAFPFFTKDLTETFGIRPDDGKVS